MNNNIPNNTVITPNTTPVVVKNSGTSGFIIALLVILLCGSLGYIYYIKVYESKNAKLSTNEVLTNTNIDASGLFQIEDTIRTFEEAYNYYDSKYFGYIYSKDSITNSDFSENAALFACIYKKYENAPVASYVSNIEVKETYRSIFGNSKRYNPSGIKVNDKHYISYNENNKYFESIYPGVGGYFYPTYFTTLESANVNGDIIEIVKNVGYIEYENNNSINIYKDDIKKDLIKKLSLKEGSFNPKELVARYKSKLSQYTYTFKMNGDKYTFESIKRTK